MVYPDRHFVGREAELEAIRACLSGTENKLFLVGMGGIGKSEIARMYLKRHAGEYDVVLWLSFEESLRHTFLSDAAVPIQGLSRADFPEDSDEEYWQRKLCILKEIADRRVLLVMDNFDVPDDPDLEAFTSGEYAVIFTTRCHQDGQRLPEVEVHPVTDRSELLDTYEYKQWLFDMAASAYTRLPKNHPLRGLTLLSRGKMLHHMSLYQDAIPFLREAILQTAEIYRKLNCPAQTERILALMM